MNKLTPQTPRRETQSKMPNEIRAILETLAWLGVVWAFDSATGYLPAVRLAYAIPVWFATNRGGLLAGAFAVSLCTTVGTYTDYLGGFINGSTTALNIVVRGLLLTGLLITIDQKERTLRSTQEVAARDPLTSAANRMAIELYAKAKIEESLLTGTVTTIAMVDCDKFKQLNDVHGHAFGDQILKTVVRTIYRNMDGIMVGRTGGDEFIVVAPGQDRASVDEALLRASKAFMDATLVMGARAQFSYGVASTKDAGISYDGLLDAADRDMYQRKALKSAHVTWLEQPAV